MKNILFIVFTLFASLQLMAQDPTDYEDNKIYRFVQQKANPKEGMEKFRQDFIEKLDLSSVPVDIEQIAIKMRFTIEKDGSFADDERVLFYEIRNDSIFQMTNTKLHKEVVRVLNIMPRWKPAQHEGQIVRSSYTTSLVVEINKVEKEQTDDKIYSEVDEKAEPQEGMEEFKRDFSRRFTVPDDVPSGIVKIRMKFVVEKDGSLTDIKVLDNRYGMGDEAIRVLKTMSKWKPAEHEGKVVRSVFEFPINIVVDRTKEASE